MQISDSGEPEECITSIRMTSAGTIVLGAADFLIQSVGMVDSRGTPVRLIDLTASRVAGPKVIWG